MIVENDSPTGDNEVRAEWVAPVVKRIDAGQAENGSGSLADDAVNFS